MRPTLNLIGRVFGKLSVIGQLIIDGRTRCQCSCECGKISYPIARTLLSGMSKSCGCGRGEFNRSRTRHGASTRSSPTPEYQIWQAMTQRCTNPKNKDYQNYGGRGIAVCTRWRIFDNFLADMGLRPFSKLMLERLDNDRGYFKANCKWATRSEQMLNRRRWTTK